MKRTLPFLTVTVLLIVAVASVTGCEDGAQDQRIEINDVLLEEGDSFTFEGDKGDLIVISSENTFRAVIAGEVEDGDYEILQSEGVIRLELIFENRDEETGKFETWDLAENQDGNVVLTDLQGESFRLKGTAKGLRRK